jgi:hypothetical protein
VAHALLVPQVVLILQVVKRRRKQRLKSEEEGAPELILDSFDEKFDYSSNI